MTKRNKTPNEDNLVRYFDITPDNVLYNIYKDSGGYFISLTYYNKMRSFENDKDPKKVIQSWNYVKAMVRLLRERNFWNYNKCKPTLNSSNDEQLKTIRCLHCNIDINLEELLYDRYHIRGKCPVCGLMLINRRKKDNDT